MHRRNNGERRQNIRSFLVLPQMTRITKLALAATGLAAFAWALTNLKPLPQTIFVLLPLLTLLLDIWAPPRAKPVAFLLTSSLATLFGFLFAASTLVAMGGQQLVDEGRRAMPIGNLLAGAAIGLSLFALSFFWILKPGAIADGTRRAGIAALFITALLALAVDRFTQ